MQKKIDAHSLQATSVAGIAGVSGAAVMSLVGEDKAATTKGAIIDRVAFDEYVRRFNARDYEGVLEYWAKIFTVSFAGYTFHNREEFIDKFYREFFHQYVNESLHIDQFISNENLLIIEARVRIQTKKELTREAAVAAGYGNLRTPPLGKTLEIPEFIHYHVADGKFISVVCVDSASPRLL